MDPPAIHLLLIEDSPTQAQVIRRMLLAYPGARFDVDWMDSTEGALTRMTNEPFDVVLLDHNLPGEDGLSFLRRAAGREGLPPIIMLTAGGDERLATEAMQAGASDYYPKSAVNTEILGHAVHKSLQRSQLADHLSGAEQVIFTLAAAVEAKDPTTQGHLQRLSFYAVRLGRALNLAEHELEILRFAGVLHDIGKMGVSESILRKPGPLTEEEWTEMRKHPVIGEGICATLRHAQRVNPIIRHHHERWDGGGYPDGLGKTAIPLGARIICAADAYDAMASDRPYRAALPADRILAELSGGAEMQFDPDVVRALVRLIETNELNADVAATAGPAAVP